MDELEIEVQKLVPEDGDVVVLKTTRPISAESAEVLHRTVERLAFRLEKKIDCLVLSDGIDIQILKTSQLPDWMKS